MRTINLAGALIALCPVIYSSPAFAGANDYVRTPVVEQGETEIDFKWGAEKLRDGTSGAAASLGLGWAPTSWWFTEVYAKYKRAPGASSGFDAWEWENRFQLTETGRYPIDVGFLLEIERPTDRTEGYELTYGPMMQAEWGAIQGNVNLFIQKHVRTNAQFDTKLLYQGQLKYRASPQFEWGAQAMGSFGRWNNWSPSSQQEHKIGPAIFGKIRVGDHQAIAYNAAILFGTTNATARTTLRLQTEYEF